MAHLLLPITRTEKIMFLLYNRSFRFAPFTKIIPPKAFSESFAIFQGYDMRIYAYHFHFFAFLFPFFALGIVWWTLHQNSINLPSIYSMFPFQCSGLFFLSDSPHGLCGCWVIVSFVVSHIFFLSCTLRTPAALPGLYPRSIYICLPCYHSLRLNRFLMCSRNCPAAVWQSSRGVIKCPRRWQ